MNAKRNTEKDREILAKILPDIIELVKRTAYFAGRIIMEVYNDDFIVEYKEDKSPLTMADKKANEYIVGILEKEFPYMAILAEESTDNLERLDNNWCWIVDPLDGTKEFVKKNGEFTVNIALSFKGRSVLGVIYVPVSDDMYWGFKDGGSFYRKDCREVYEGDYVGSGPDIEYTRVNEGIELTGEKINVSTKVEDLILLHSRSYKTPKIYNLIELNKVKIKEIRCAGSSLKGCLIAKGEGDIYYRYGPTMEWDTAAMHCIIEEAGGILKQMDNSEMIYNRKDSLNRKGFYILNSLENKLIIESK